MKITFKQHMDTLLLRAYVDVLRLNFFPRSLCQVVYTPGLHLETCTGGQKLKIGDFWGRHTLHPLYINHISQGGRDCGWGGP